jgi:hypothetical protein
MRTWIRNTASFLANLRIYDMRTGTKKKICGFAIPQYSFLICGFAICGLARLRNLRICDCGMRPRIYGFSFCGLTKNCVPTFVLRSNSCLPCLRLMGPTCHMTLIPTPVLSAIPLRSEFVNF